MKATAEDIGASFSKALGGGLPISAYGAGKEIMQLVSDRLAVHAGTFNGNALSCAAAKTVLAELKKDGSAAIKRINEMGRELMAGISRMDTEIC